MNKKTGSGRAIEKSHRTRALPHEAAVAKLRSIYTLPIFKLIGLPEKLCPGEDIVTWAGFGLRFESQLLFDFCDFE